MDIDIIAYIYVLVNEEDRWPRLALHYIDLLPKVEREMQNEVNAHHRKITGNFA